jgi:pimeloyl-ACP methyl ester carboxylesterase
MAGRRGTASADAWNSSATSTHGPTLPSHGRDVPTNVGYREAAESVAGYVAQHDLRDIVLVGHSGGGIAISNAVEIITDRVQRLVCLSGWVLKDGESILDKAPAHYREPFSGMAAESPDDTVGVPFDAWRSNFINDADEALARSAFKQLVAVFLPGRTSEVHHPLQLDGTEVRHPADRGHRLASRRGMGRTSGQLSRRLTHGQSNFCSCHAPQRLRDSQWGLIESLR